MSDSGSVRLRVVYKNVGKIKKLAKVWSKSRTQELIDEIKEVLSLLRTKKQLEVKKLLRHLVATLSGVVAGRKEKVITVKRAKRHLFQLIPVVKTLRTEIKELGIMEEPSSPTEEKKTITIRPGVDEVGQEAQNRIQDAITTDDGTIRQGTSGSSEELSHDEKQWEDAEFNRIIKDQRLEEWNNNFYGEIGHAFIKYKPQIDALAKTIKQRAILQVGPVVPSAKTDAIFRVRDLERSGNVVTFITGCPVFEDQLLLTINTNELADDAKGTDQYKGEYRNYRKRLGVYTNKFGPVEAIRKSIAEYQEELDWYGEVPAGATDIGADKNVAADSRTFRANWVKSEIARLEKKAATLEASLVKEREEFAVLEAEFKEFSKQGRSQYHGKMASYPARCLALAEKCLATINSRFGPEEQISLVSKQGFSHGQTSLFWVMRDTRIGIWSQEIAMGKLTLEILDWCLPKPQQSSSMRLLQREVEIRQGLIMLIQRLVLKEYARTVIDTKVAEYLTSYRIKYEEEMLELVGQILADIPDVLGLKIPPPLPEVKLELAKVKPLTRKEVKPSLKRVPVFNAPIQGRNAEMMMKDMKKKTAIELLKLKQKKGIK